MTRRITLAPDVLRHHLALLDEAFDHKAWHGTTLRGALRGVTAEAAARRPAAGRHSIWEVTVHAAYWKYAVARRLTGEKRGRFPLEGSNWFPQPDEPGEAAWRAAIKLLEEQHRRLREIVSQVDAEQLSEQPPGSNQTREYMIRGIAAHDLYHAGQIQLTKKLIGSGLKAQAQGSRHRGIKAFRPHGHES